MITSTPMGEDKESFTFHEFMEKFEDKMLGKRLRRAVLIADNGATSFLMGTYGEPSELFGILFQGLGAAIEEVADETYLVRVEKALKLTQGLIDKKRVSLPSDIESFERSKPSKFAGKTLNIAAGEFAGQEYRVEGWAHHVFGKSWPKNGLEGNAACMEYGLRLMKEGLPHDERVYYGKIGVLGKLIHVTQLKEKTQ